MDWHLVTDFPYFEISEQRCCLDASGSVNKLLKEVGINLLSRFNLEGSNNPCCCARSSLWVVVGVLLNAGQSSQMGCQGHICTGLNSSDQWNLLNLPGVAGSIKTLVHFPSMSFGAVSMRDQASIKLESIIVLKSSHMRCCSWAT